MFPGFQISPPEGLVPEGFEGLVPDPKEDLDLGRVLVLDWLPLQLNLQSLHLCLWTKHCLCCIWLTHRSIGQDEIRFPHVVLMPAIPASSWCSCSVSFVVGSSSSSNSLPIWRTAVNPLTACACSVVALPGFFRSLSPKFCAWASRDGRLDQKKRRGKEKQGG